MSGSIGTSIPPVQLPKVQAYNNGGAQIHLGKSEYQFNQVLNLVAPTKDGDSLLTGENSESLNAESVAQVNAMLEERNESKSAWKLMAAAAKRNSFNQADLAQNMGRDAYKVYTGSSQTNNSSSQGSSVVVSEGVVDFIH
ncbi:MAG: hypothetical protein HQL71_15180 [Magnetococcales bacterium]|nr:hypothetical protein [Magnetococcales bacterium]